MRAVTLCLCASLIVSVVTAGLLEKLLDGLQENMNKLEERMDSLMNKSSSQERQLQAAKSTNNAQEKLLDEKMNKTEEKVASLMSKQQSIIEKQASKMASLEDLTRKQNNTIDELGKENDDQARRLGQYAAEIKKQEETINAQGSKLSSLEKQLQKEKNTNTAQEDKLSTLERQVEAENNTINEDTQGSLELLNEKMNKTEEKVASLMSKQQSIIEKQASELNKMASFEDLIRKQNNTIDELSKENYDQARGLGQYQAGFKKQEETINAQGSKLSSLERELQAEKNTNTAQASQLTKLTTPQYFNVFLTESKNIAPGQVVVFNGLIDDPDTLYSNTTGAFTCKVPGLYVFTLNVMSQHGNGVLWLAIIVNGAGKATTHANGRLDQASQTVTTALKAGDEVKVIGVYQESYVFGAKWVYSTFTGRLVTPAL